MSKAPWQIPQPSHYNLCDPNALHIMTTCSPQLCHFFILQWQWHSCPNTPVCPVYNPPESIILDPLPPIHLVVSKLLQSHQTLMSSQSQTLQDIMPG